LKHKVLRCSQYTEFVDVKVLYQSFTIHGLTVKQQPTNKYICDQTLQNQAIYTKLQIDNNTIIIYIKVLKYH